MKLQSHQIAPTHRRGYRLTRAIHAGSGELMLRGCLEYVGMVEINVGILGGLEEIVCAHGLNAVPANMPMRRAERDHLPRDEAQALGGANLD